MRIVVLTGAGISAESGLATFRDAGGLWEGQRPEDVATPEAFVANRAMVQRFYDARRAELITVAPNAAHEALADLGQQVGDELVLVTQNVDDLHERAGSSGVIHMHGELLRARCEACGGQPHWDRALVDEPSCPICGVPALRPDVVWFGELPYQMELIEAELQRCDLFAAIGTSGQVYPAAGFVERARRHGARTVELNLEPTESRFDEAIVGPASLTVPAWVAGITGRTRPSTALHIDR